MKAKLENHSEEISGLNIFFEGQTLKLTQKETIYKKGMPLLTS
jgi:hypothetical protein